MNSKNIVDEEAKSIMTRVRATLQCRTVGG